MKKVSCILFWLIWSAGAGAIIYYPVPAALAWFDTFKDGTGPLGIIVLAMLLIICLGAPLLGVSIASKFGWYSKKEKKPFIRILRIAFAIFCGLLSIPGVIKIGYLWLAEGMFGPFAGFCFAAVPLLLPIGICAVVASEEEPK